MEMPAALSGVVMIIPLLIIFFFLAALVTMIVCSVKMVTLPKEERDKRLIFTVFFFVSLFIVLFFILMVSFSIWMSANMMSMISSIT